MLNTINELFRRHLYFLLFVLVSVFFFWRPLRSLIRFSLAHDYGSHILLIVPTSAYVIYLNRQRIFSSVRTDFFAASSLFALSAGLWCIVHLRSHENSNYAAVEILSIIILWLFGFVLCYGLQAFQAARFPLLFLGLLIPMPDFLLEKVIVELQAASAAVAYWLLSILNVPAFKNGFVIVLPTIDIEVARQCSGIRSSVALLITTLLLGNFVLRSSWRKALLVISIVPILIVKNGLRIVAVSLLTIYVDRAFLHGWLHTSGGVVFYALGLFALMPIVTLLKKSEIRTYSSKENLTWSGTDAEGMRGENRQ